MTTDHLTRIITAAPGIRADLWQAVAADLVEQLATVTAERDIARAEREALAVSKVTELEATGSHKAAIARGDVYLERAGELGTVIRDLRAKVAELEARPVLTVERLAEAMAMGPGSAEFVMDKLGPVTLPAQDRAEELIAACVDEYAAAHAALRPPSWSEYTADGRVNRVEAMRAALAKVGAPSPAVAPGPDAAEFLIDKMRSYGWHFLTSPEAAPDLRRAIAAMPKPPPVAPGPVLAGVSAEELHAEYERAGYGAPGMRAVVARLGASLVAPVDPEAVARTMRDHATRIGLHPVREPDDYLASLALLVRQCFTAHGIPVTPEVGE